MDNQSQKLSKLSMVMYGLGDLASQFVWTFVGTYLTVYYTDIVGLVPAIASAIMLIARIWDGIIDPVMGMIAERTRTKWGRFRPYILFGSPFLALFSVLTFTGPFGNGTMGIIWATFTYIVAGMLYTLVNIPYGSMAAVMTTDDHERNMLNSFRSVGMNLGMVIVNSLSSILMLTFSNGSKTATQSGYFMTALIYAIISLPLFYGVFKTAREVVKPIRTEKIPISVTLKNVIGNRHLMIVFVIMLLQMTGFMGRIAVTTYYVIYCLGSFTLISILMTIPSIGGALCSMLVAPLTKRFGKKNVLTASFLIQALGLFVVYCSDFSNIGMIVFGHILYGIANIGFPITLTMVADSVDYQELETGIRTDGTAYATYGLATKIGNALGGSLGILALSYFGYQPNIQQSVETQNGINLVVNLIPAILFVVAGLIGFWKWDLSAERMDEIHFQLEDKRTIREFVDETSSVGNPISDEMLFAPVTGRVLDYTKINDNIFASGALGKGVGIKPNTNILLSPVDGEIISIAPTGHVYTLKTDFGANLLLHIGINTVTLGGKGFAKTVKVGDRVKVGDQLGAFDRDIISEADLDDIVMLFVTNSVDYSSIHILENDSVDYSDHIIELIK